MEDLTHIAGCKMKKLTIADVAKQANVSISTVSQFLNNRFEYMSEETRKKIEEAVKQLNYRPNMVARSLKNKGTQTIGVIVANIMHSFTTQIIHYLEQSLQPHGFHVTVCNSSDDSKKEREHIEMLLAKQVDGYIILPTGDNMELYEHLYESNIPVVFIDRIVANSEIPVVLLNNELASIYAVESLLKKDKKHLVVVTPSIERQLTPRVERIEGFRKAMKQNNILYKEEQVIAAPLQAINEKLQNIVRHTKVDGIIAGNDRVLIEVLHFIKSNQLTEQIDVAVIDDIPLAKFFVPAIGRITQPTKEMATKAADVLLEIKVHGYEGHKKKVYRFDPMIMND